MDKPELKLLFIAATKATLKEDIERDSDTLFKLIYENETFEDRVISNFIILASGYYSKDEITYWIENDFFSKKEQPKSFDQLNHDLV